MNLYTIHQAPTPYGIRESKIKIISPRFQDWEVIPKWLLWAVYGFLISSFLIYTRMASGNYWFVASSFYFFDRLPKYPFSEQSWISVSAHQDIPIFTEFSQFSSNTPLSVGIIYIFPGIVYTTDTIRFGNHPSNMQGNGSHPVLSLPLPIFFIPGRCTHYQKTDHLLGSACHNFLQHFSCC